MSKTPSPEKRVSTWHKSLKVFSLIVLALLAVVIVYVSVIAIKNWSYIGV